jgi:hypothetical protein
MNKLRLRIARLTLALGVVALVWACNAPSIPVPPPGESVRFTSALVPDGAGGQKTVWIANGATNSVSAFARVFVFDATAGAGVIGLAASDGSYMSPPMDGTRGDRVEISFETVQGVLSASTCFQLIEGAAAPACQPP